MSVNIVLNIKCHLDGDYNFVEYVDAFLEAMCIYMIPQQFF